jgi:hypothetical protein
MPNAPSAMNIGPLGWSFLSSLPSLMSFIACAYRV